MVGWEFVLRCREVCRRENKVGVLMIRLTSGDRYRCDLTHKPRYFDEKLEWGGSSHEMMEITVCIVDG